MKRVSFTVIALFLLQAYYLSNSSSAVAQASDQIQSTRHAEYPTFYSYVNGVRIAYQDFGKPENEVVLLVMGLGGQLIHWEDKFVNSLVEQGYRVIRYDNRDSGWSGKLFESGTPGVLTLLRYKLGLPLGAPYKLDDMAADGIGLLDHLNIAQAHIAGVSMGGMIAQIMAAKYPERITTMTSIMSSSGDPSLPVGDLQPSLESTDGLSREEIIRSRAAFAQQLDGTVAELSEAQWIQRMARSYDRSHYPDGTARQLWAIGDSGDRVELLKQITQPSLVVHGTADRLIPPRGGEHAAELIPNAKLVLLEGMGHFIDQANEPLLLDQMLKFLNQHSLTQQTHRPAPKHTAQTVFHH